MADWRFAPNPPYALARDFDFDNEDLDMVYFVMPDIEIPQMQQVVQVSTAGFETVASGLVQKTYGVCNVGHSGTGPRPVPLGPVYTLIDLFPKDMQQRWKNNALNDDEALAFDEWSESLKITLLQAPTHGIIKKGFPGYANSEYIADIDFVGVDRFEFLVEGKDIKGAPIKIKLAYFIKVVSEEEWEKKAGKVEGFGRKLCPKDSWVVPVGSASLAPHDELGAINFKNLNNVTSTWPIEPAYSELAYASSLLSGFSDLPGTSRGQATGHGPTAKIALDTNAAGYGWFIVHSRQST